MTTTMTMTTYGLRLRADATSPVVPSLGVPALQERPGVTTLGTPAFGMPAFETPSLGMPASGVSASGVPACGVSVLGTPVLGMPVLGIPALLPVGLQGTGPSAAGTDTDAFGDRLGAAQDIAAVHVDGDTADSSGLPPRGAPV